jgi:hypothetical protein
LANGFSSSEAIHFRAKAQNAVQELPGAFSLSNEEEKLIDEDQTWEYLEKAVVEGDRLPNTKQEVATRRALIVGVCYIDLLRC